MEPTKRQTYSAAKPYPIECAIPHSEFRTPNFKNFVFLLCLVSFGCTHYNYSPNLVATPFLNKKNESTLTVNTGGTLFLSNQDVQAAYNPLKGVTVMTNYFNAYSSVNQIYSSQQNQSYRIRYFDGAVGGWYFFHREDFQLGCFLGAGTGSTKNDFDKDRMTRLRYNKLYLQPTFCYTGSLFRIGIATRFSNLSYTKGRINNAIPVVDLQVLKQIEQDSPFQLMEAGFNFGIRLNPVTVSGSIVTGRMFGSSNYDNYLFDEANIAVGVALDLHYFYQKKKGKNSTGTPDPNVPK